MTRFTSLTLGTVAAIRMDVEMDPYAKLVDAARVYANGTLKDFKGQDEASRAKTLKDMVNNLFHADTVPSVETMLPCRKGDDECHKAVKDLKDVEQQLKKSNPQDVMDKMSKMIGQEAQKVMGDPKMKAGMEKVFQEFSKPETKDAAMKFIEGMGDLKIPGMDKDALTDSLADAMDIMADPKAQKGVMNFMNEMMTNPKAMQDAMAGMAMLQKNQRPMKTGDSGVKPLMDVVEPIQPMIMA